MKERKIHYGVLGEGYYLTMCGLKMKIRLREGEKSRIREDEDENVNCKRCERWFGLQESHRS